MFSNPKSGWIGIDCGSDSVKAVQLTRTGDALHVEAAAITPRWLRATDSPKEQRRSECLALKALAPELRGRNVAASLSMEECSLESYDRGDSLPQPDESGDYWSSGPDGGYILRSKTESIEQLCFGVRKSGLKCNAIDGAPTAIARALGMTSRSSAGELLGALDIGASSATLVVARDGLAVYARKIKEFGVKQLIETLDMPRSEAEKVILEYGFSSHHERAPEVLLRELRPFLAELQRSLLHLRGKLKSKGPSSYQLFGVGALIPGIAGYVSESLEAEASPWEPSDFASNEQQLPPLCLLGQAIALSALAWEAA